MHFFQCNIITSNELLLNPGLNLTSFSELGLKHSRQNKNYFCDNPCSLFRVIEKSAVGRVEYHHSSTQWIDTVFGHTTWADTGGSLDLEGGN